MSKQYKQIISLLAMGTLASVTGPVCASGFGLLEQSAAGLRTAYSGTAAIAEDASTGYYNSAGLTRLREEQIVFSAIGIAPYSKINATRATPTIHTIRGRVVPTSPENIAPGSGRSRSFTVIPTLHYFKRLSDSWAFGFNVTTPHGLRTRYKNDSVVRFMSTRAELRTYDLSPSVAYSFGNGLSLGLGVDFIHTLAKLDSRVGFGSRTVPDGFFENTLSRWSIGGHAGALFEFNDCTRIGVQYRSGYKAKARGDSRLVFRGLNVHETQGIRARIRMPSSTVVSAYHDVTDRWALMADVQFTDWKKFNKVVAHFDDRTTLVQNFDFKNTTRYALGTSFQFDDCWLGSLGTAYDRSAVRKANQRTVMIPDSNRYWAAIGVRYQFHQCLALDVGYAHLFFQKANIQQGAPAWNVALPIQQSIQGRFRSRADLMGIQLTWDLV